jgi:ankyrin repeat protein
MNEIATEFFRFCNSRHITSRDLDEYIRKNDINPTITDNLGRTVLHICSKNANADVVLHLLRNYNLNPNIADILGRTPICETVICLGSTANVCQTIKHLAQFGANLNHISDDGYNSL